MDSENIFSKLLGKTISRIEEDQNLEGNDRLTFTMVSGEKLIMTHDQDCCESVWLEDVCGDLDDLVGLPVLLAEEETNEEDEDMTKTWTFYKISTNRGSVTFRWYGESNGYYSESVDLKWIPSPPKGDEWSDETEEILFDE